MWRSRGWGGGNIGCFAGKQIQLSERGVREVEEIHCLRNVNERVGIVFQTELFALDEECRIINVKD
jgi:hypothetical protein